MASTQQIEANRKNPPHSTGPRTQEGKDAVRLNALKHGLLARQILLEDEDERVLDEFAAGLHNQLQPVGDLECALMERAVSALWQLPRLLIVEADMYASQRRDFLDHETGIGATFRRISRASDAFPKLARYEATIERGFYKALHELLRVQAARKGQATPLPIAVDIDVSGVSENAA